MTVSKTVDLMEWDLWVMLSRQAVGDIFVSRQRKKMWKCARISFLWVSNKICRINIFRYVDKFHTGRQLLCKSQTQGNSEKLILCITMTVCTVNFVGFCRSPSSALHPGPGRENSPNFPPPQWALQPNFPSIYVSRNYSGLFFIWH